MLQMQFLSDDLCEFVLRPRGGPASARPSYITLRAFARQLSESRRRFLQPCPPLFGLFLAIASTFRCHSAVTADLVSSGIALRAPKLEYTK